MMSGANDYGRELVQGLGQLCSLTVVTVDDSPLRGSENVDIYPVFPAFGSAVSRRAKLVQTIVAFCQLLKLVWDHRRDAVHVQFFRFGLIDILFYLACIPWVRCFVYTAHNVLPHEERWWHKTVYKRWYRCVDRLHVLSSNAQQAISKLSGRSPSRIEVVPHGNYETLYSNTLQVPIPDLRDYGIPSGNRVALFFGLIRDYKGVDNLIAAAKLVPGAVGLTVVVAGSGAPELLRSYRSEAALLLESGRMVIIDRRLSDQELASLLRLADFTVFPYRNIYQSGALMLALTFGRPVLAADLPGFREYVDDNIGVICDCRSPEKLATALTLLCESGEMRRRLGAAARAAALEKYDWALISRALQTLYV